MGKLLVKIDVQKIGNALAVHTTVVNLAYKKVTSGLPFYQSRYNSFATRTHPEPFRFRYRLPSPGYMLVPEPYCVFRTVPVRRRRAYCVFIFSQIQTERKESG